MTTASSEWRVASGKWRAALFALGVAVLLSACATPPDTAIKQPLRVLPPAATALSEDHNGSIFRAAPVPTRPAMALFEDRRARYVGDTLTVNLVERSEARRRSETTDERKANANIDIPAPLLLGRNLPVLGEDGVTRWEPSASNRQEFKDNETNSNSVTGSITVSVVEVLANGHLVVAGEKQVAVNNDTDYIRLAGIVNPAQISATNSVNSTQLANAQIESKNSQSLDKAHLTSLMTRFFLTLLPF